MKRVCWLLPAAFCLATAQCRSVPVDHPAPPAACQPSLYNGISPQTCSQEYAGELLAYFMQVVLGKAGRPDLREEWRSRALDQPLDLEAVRAILNGGGQDKSKLMVLDANLQGFSEVLYHYDPRLNQFKGRFVYHSVYPSAELIALRLLLLKKIHRGEKIDLIAVLAHRELLLTDGRRPAPRVLKEMNLEADEFRLLQQVFRADPQLVAYLGNPFLVEALVGVRALRSDRQVAGITHRASYRDLYPAAAHRRTQGSPAPAVTVAILPSMNKEFVSGCVEPSGTDRFLPTEDYRNATAAIVRGLRERIRTRFRETASPALAASGDAERTEAALHFFNADKRPLVVHPQNADRVLADVCPHADYVIILLGENVYRAMDLDPRRDTHPLVNRFYIDIADVRHEQIETELNQIAEAVSATLVERLAQNPRSVSVQRRPVSFQSMQAPVRVSTP